MSRLSESVVGIVIAASLLGCTAGSTGSTIPGTASQTPASAPASPSPTPSAPASAARIDVPAALRGTWTANVTGTTATSGTWTLDITAIDLRLTNPNATAAEAFSIGPTKVTSSELTLWADAGCPDQTTVTEGTYTVKVQGNQLTFTLVSDSCGDRSAVLIAKPWSRKP